MKNAYSKVWRYRKLSIITSKPSINFTVKLKLSITYYNMFVLSYYEEKKLGTQWSIINSLSIYY